MNILTNILTATHDINSPKLDINKGDRYEIHINMTGINPNNLFSSSRCKDALIQQFHNNGIDVPYSDKGIYNHGTWKIDMQKW